VRGSDTVLSLPTIYTHAVCVTHLMSTHAVVYTTQVALEQRVRAGWGERQAAWRALRHQRAISGSV
jgi:hypothetical protein